MIDSPRVEGRFSRIIHELEDVILSEAPAKTFRPPAFAGRAGAQWKDMRFVLTAVLAALSKWKRGLFCRVCLAHRFGSKQSVVDAMQALDHGRRQQLVVMDFQ